MREQFFLATESGLTRGQLRWGESQGRWRRIVWPVYRHGPEEPSDLDRSLGVVLAVEGVASCHLAGVLHGLDSVALVRGRPVVSIADGHLRAGARRRRLAGDEVVEVKGFRCTSGLTTMIDLAATLSDDVWEQALESALRKKLFTVDDLMARLPDLGRARTPGVTRMRRVLALRPEGAAPTESLLETLMVQLARLIPGLPPFVRQLEIFDQHGVFVARVDLSWPELGIFIELDGQQHIGQPVYDASRETAVVAATGWFPGRFTWTEVTRTPRSSARRLDGIVAQARRRRFVGTAWS